jgi:threonyl-tRNA synthetase
MVAISCSSKGRDNGMRLLMWHCRSLRSRDVKRSDRPQGIAAVASDPVTQTFSDVLAVFTCIESKDSEETVARAADEVRLIADDVGCQDIVIVPFAHLSSDVMVDDPARAKALVDEVGDAIAQLGFHMTMTSFGFHKEFELHFVAKEHELAVTFRNVPPRAPRDSHSVAKDELRKEKT